MKFVDDFKKFAFKGNVIDMAVGVIIGGAFTAVVTSLVNNIIMPVISYLTAGLDLTDLKFVLREAVVEDGNVVTAECAIGYGVLIQNIVYLLLVAISIFVFVKIIRRGKEKHDAEEAAKAKVKADAEAATAKEKAELTEARAANEEMLLSEIRDLLKNRQ